VLAQFKPQPNEDVLFIFIGDQADSQPHFAPTVERSGLRPTAFGLIEVVGTWGSRGNSVEVTAARLGIPCFRIDEKTFDDPYSVTRTIRNLIESTPVSEGVVGRTEVHRESLVEKILKTDLLKKPAWA